MDKRDKHPRRPLSKPHTPARRLGSAAADWYDQLVGDSGSEYHRHVVIPGAMRLLEVKPGTKILDVGCGQGVLCRVMHEAGAVVTGIDASAELIRLARQRGPADIKYTVCDAVDLARLGPAAFDAASCILAIQNMPKSDRVLSAIAGCLVDGGRLAIVMMHPCFRSPKFTSWGWEGTAVQYRRVDRYMTPHKEPIYTHPGKSDGEYTWTYHRSLSGYIRALRRAGFLIDELDEWTSHKTSEPGPRAAAENTARKEIPLFLAIRAIKLAT